MDSTTPPPQAILDRRDQYAHHASLPQNRSREHKVPDAIASIVASVVDLAPDDTEANAKAERERKIEEERKHRRKWRDNLLDAAPIERWEQAWSVPGVPVPRLAQADLDRLDKNPQDNRLWAELLGGDDGSNGDKPENWPATRAVKRWLAGGAYKHLVLQGAVGCGKSVGAAVAVKQWVQPGETFSPVSWLMPEELISAIFHSYDPNAPKLARYIVIDDMGTEKRDDFAVALCKLLDRTGHTIIITTNLAVTHDDPAKTFVGRYKDPRLISRMNDTCVRYQVPGGDRRSKAGGFG